MIIQKIDFLFKNFLEKNNLKDINYSFLSIPDNLDLDFHLSSNILIILKSKKINHLNEEFIRYLKNSNIFSNIEIMKNGFLNFKFSTSILNEFIVDIFKNGNKNLINYNDNNFEEINIEFVSCNPTGPMHIGHLRGAIIGDVISNIFNLKKFKIKREFAINDNGKQVDVLFDSVFLKIKDILNIKIEPDELLNENLYKGSYIKDIAVKIIENFGDNIYIIKEKKDKVLDFIIELVLKGIKNTLKSLKVDFDVFRSVQKCIDERDVDLIFNLLESEGFVYKSNSNSVEIEKDYSLTENDKLLIFNTREFGDDKDRVLRKGNGELTYFAGDLFYHKDKIERGFKEMILILGSDHKGYKKRMEALVDRISQGAAKIKVIFYELVNFIKDEKAVKMSKRKGNFLTVDDVLEELNSDLLRFHILSYKKNTIINFDVEKAKEKKKENLAFYVQYANIRCISAMKKIGLNEKIDLNLFDFNSIDLKEFNKLISKFIGYNLTIDRAYSELEPHYIVNYLTEISAIFHQLWHAGNEVENLRFISNNKIKSITNYIFLGAFNKILESTLDILKIKALKEM